MKMIQLYGKEEKMSIRSSQHITYGISFALHILGVPWFKLIWFKQRVPRFAFIAWLAVKDRLSTGVRIRVWRISQGYSFLESHKTWETICCLRAPTPMVYGCRLSNHYWYQPLRLTGQILWLVLLARCMTGSLISSWD